LNAHTDAFFTFTVEMSPGTLLQYHAMEAKKFWKESVTTKKVTKKSEDHCCNKKTFFNAYENLPPFHEEFFDCFEEEEFENNEQHQVNDLLNPDSVHRAGIVVDCTKVIIGTGSTQECTSSEPKIPGTLLAQESTEDGNSWSGSKSESEQHGTICPNWGNDCVSGRKQYHAQVVTLDHFRHRS
jgi:hypothetical protein